MKKFKFLMIAMAVAMLAGFSSCNDDKIEGLDNGTDRIGDAYFSIQITVPNGDDSSLKGAEDSNIYETGTAAETAVQNVTLYLFDDATDLFVERIDLTTADLAAAPPTYTSKRLPINAGDYKVVAVVNHGGAALPVAPVDVDGLLAATMLPTDYNSGLINPIPSTGLMMSSRTNVSGATSPYATLNVTTANIISNPATFTIQVERSVAKLTIAPPDVTGDVTGINEYLVRATEEDESTITITDYHVVNLRNSGYMFRHTFDPVAPAIGYGSINNGGGDTNPFLYVWDPQSANKTFVSNAISASASSWYLNHTSTVVAGDVAEGMPTATGFSLVGYCLENTMLKDAQRNGYSTGVIFKGNIVPTVVYEDDGLGDVTPVAPTGGVNLYHYGGRYYETLADLTTDPGTPFAAGSLDAFTAAQLAEFSIILYIGGDCYYTYWIKHEHSTNNMEVMEFAIVRNNVYNMRITGLSRPGSGDVVIDVDDPNESNDLYMQMELVVMPWIVRTNDIVF